MKPRTFFIGLAAFLMAVVGAYFSIQGLSVLFSGAKLEVQIMTGVLEFSKLVTASFVYLYWKELKWFFKSFLIVAIVTLVFITSIGIYGFLTSAFQFSSEELSILERRIENIEQRKNRFQIQIDGDVSERDNLTSTILILSEGLSGNVIQYVDQETGQLITTTSAANRNVLSQQLNQANDRRDLVSNRIEAFTDSVTILDEQVLELRSGSDVVRELGPLQFISDVTGYPMSSAVNIIALIITVTYDPLAVSLVIAFNLSLGYSRRRREPTDRYNWYGIYGENKPVLTNDIEEDDTYTQTEDIVRPDEDLVGETTNKEEDTPNVNNNSTIAEVKDVETKTETISIDAPLRTPKPIIPPKKQIGRVPVYIDKEKTELVGYDTDGDGMIDIPTHSMDDRYAKNKKPYYARHEFDWNDKSQWINDQAAVNYWLTNIWSNKSYSKYPDNFDSKTY